LNEILGAEKFDRYVERLCEDHYAADKKGRL
jgi:hypothetical protein